MKNLHFCFFVLFFLLSSNILSAHQRKVPFAEVAQTADVILIGTVSDMKSDYTENRNGIYTEVQFTNLEVINATNELSKNIARQASYSLRYLGGEVEGEVMMLSQMPEFEKGGRYMIFVKNDGRPYANPLVGGAHGQYRILEDASGLNRDEYVLDHDNHLLVGLDAKSLSFNPAPVNGIRNGVADFQPLENKLSNMAPQPDDKYSYASLPQEAQFETRPVSLNAFKSFIMREAMTAPIETPLLRFGGTGSFHFRDGADIPFEELIPKFNSNERRERPTKRDNERAEGGQLGACGTHDLNIVMEQLPESWWGWQVNNDAMWIWNQFMDMYRYVESDGNIRGGNNENEFAGWWDNATYKRVYGFEWGSGIAVCITRARTNCRSILESDIIYNPAYSWTNDFNFSLGNSSVINLLPNTMHELGHSWGYQLGTYEETYDYDRLSVMHAYYSNVVEDGRGIHATDANIVRRHYDDQTYVKYIKDVGCESYYASNGLRNSTTDRSWYYSGNYMTIRNFVVENMSKYNTSNVKVRFYLSTNKTITTSDTQIGGAWTWSTFNKESTSRYDYRMRLPRNISTGTYYVGAIVTVDGYNSDDYSRNDRTFLYNTITVYRSSSDMNNNSVAKSKTDQNQSIAKELEVNIFPNPASSNDVFTMNLIGESNEEMVLKVVNALGQVVEQKVVGIVDGFTEVRFGENLIKGRYIVQVIDQQGIRRSKAVVKL